MTFSLKDLLNLIPEKWKTFIGDEEFNKPYWNQLYTVLSSGDFYPSFENIFKAFEIIDPEDVKVALIGQDPYINPNQAIGISFGVNNGCNIPPSLRNIYKEIIHEYGLILDIKKYSQKGDISMLSKEGVLLMNNVFTVQPHKSLSHKLIGWENFSKAIIKALDKNNKLVFVGFGNYIKDVLLNHVKLNKVLIYGHPSPLNTSKPFIGCGCFKEINEVLQHMNIVPVDWTRVFDENE